MTSLARATVDQMNLLASSGAPGLPGLAVSQGRIRVAVADGAIVGFAAWFIARDAVEVEELFVDPARMATEPGGRWYWT